MELIVFCMQYKVFFAIAIYLQAVRSQIFGTSATIKELEKLRIYSSRQIATPDCD